MKSELALQHLTPVAASEKGVAVQDALVAMIESAKLGIGDRLPPEVQMVHKLGVSRSTIREALNRWEGLGLIRRRRGDGTYLTARIPASHGPLSTMIQLEGEALLRLLEVRRVLETGVVRQAALLATPDQRKNISILCGKLLETVDAGLAYKEADWAFHSAINEATGNPLFGQLLTHLDHAFERSKGSPFSHNGFGLASFPMHRDLSNAIVNADPDEAARAVNKIIDSVAAAVRSIIAVGPENEQAEI